MEPVRRLERNESQRSGGAACTCRGSGVAATRPLPRDEAWTNSTKTQHSDHPPWSGLEVKNERSSAKDGAPERLGCRTI